MNVSTESENRPGQEATPRENRDFSLIPNPDLRNHLIETQNRMGDKQTFTLLELIRLHSPETYYNGGMKITSPRRMGTIFERVHAYRMVEHDVIKIINRLTKVSDREQAFANSAIGWICLTRFPIKPIIPWQNAHELLLPQLGEDPLSKEIFPPDKNRRFESEFTRVRRRGKEEDEASPPQPVDTETGEFWKTPAGEYVKKLVEEPLFSSLKDNMKAVMVQQALQLRFSEDTTFIYKLSNAQVLEHKNRKRSAYLYDRQHMILAGLFFAHIAQGYIPSQAYESVERMVAGSSLSDYLGDDPNMGEDFESITNIYSPHSPWRNIPLPPPPADTDGEITGHRGFLTPGTLQRLDERRAVVSWHEKVYRYSQKINPAAIKKLREWTREKLEEAYQNLPSTAENVSYRDIDPDVAKAIVMICEMDAKTYRDPDDLLDEMWSRTLRTKFPHVLNYFDKYTKLKNLGQLMYVRQKGAEKRFESTKDGQKK